MGEAFTLLPFSPAAWLEGLRLQASVEREPTQLCLHYRLEGPLRRLAIPAASHELPQRRDGLWQSTCFEAFIGLAGEPSYWEVNLSPCGDWNVYRLEGYRAGLRPETDVQSLSWTSQRSPEQLSIRLNVPLGPLGAQPQHEPCIELGITAVLQARDGSCSYWAIRHTGPEADFHRRDSFIRLD